jgi:glycosyltransferase involved in cell wall biosynthesis
MERPENVHLLGFISDEDACALIKNCRAFLFPSLYEGFGLPPLEALALGAQVISSNTTSLPEVLGDAVHYVDPYDFDVEITGLLKETVGQAQDTLNKYSWNRSSIHIYRLLCAEKTNYQNQQ